MHQIQTAVFVRAARDLGVEDSLAQTMVKSLLLKLQAAVEALDPVHMNRLNPDDLLKLALQAARALSAVQSAEAGTALRSLELALKRARLSETERESMRRAAVELCGLLKQHPKVWQLVEPILAPLAQAPALPEVAGG
jgi:hypothetical protein